MDTLKLFTRKQSAEILDLTPQQFDYWQRQLKIEPLKFGYNQVLYTEEMLAKAKLALLLKDHKISKSYIRNILEQFGESILKLSELFLVKSPVKLETTFPKVKPDHYLVTKEELKEVGSVIFDALTNKGCSTGLSIDLLANLQEANEEMKQKMEELTNSLSNSNHDKIPK